MIVRDDEEGQTILLGGHAGVSQSLENGAWLLQTRMGGIAVWNIRSPDTPVEPFRNVSYKPPEWKGEEIAFAKETIDKRLREGVWVEIPPIPPNGEYLSTDCIARGNSGKLRSVAGLHHLSTHWEPRYKKQTTLEAFAVVFKQDDFMISFDLQGSHNHFRLNHSMRK